MKTRILKFSSLEALQSISKHFFPFAFQSSIVFYFYTFFITFFRCHEQGGGPRMKKKVSAKRSEGGEAHNETWDWKSMLWINYEMEQRNLLAPLPRKKIFINKQDVLQCRCFSCSQFIRFSLHFGEWDEEKQIEKASACLKFKEKRKKCEAARREEKHQQRHRKLLFFCLQRLIKNHQQEKEKQRDRVRCSLILIVPARGTWSREILWIL